MNTKQPFLGMLEKRGEHWVHGLECREPFVKRPEFVDAHSNEKNNERVVNSVVYRPGNMRAIWISPYEYGSDLKCREGSCDVLVYILRQTERISVYPTIVTILLRSKRYFLLLQDLKMIQKND